MSARTRSERPRRGHSGVHRLSRHLASPLLVCLGLAPSLLCAQTVRDSSLKVEQLVSGLSKPTTMAFVGPNDILVLQKNDGRVRRVIDGVLQPGHVIDVHVDNSSERGLLGIALHPQFPSVPLVYLYYTESSTGADTTAMSPLGNRVYVYTWDGASLTNPTLILHLPTTPGPNHDGGVITFGPDGKLFVVIGDLNRNGQLQNFPSGAPDDTSVILRLNEDGSIPPDNPFAAEGGNLAKYYAYGIRNSFGLAFDPVTDSLWLTENGTASFDEINVVDPGFNSGWAQLMGPDSRDPQGTANLHVIPNSHYRDPRFSWLEVVGPTALAFLNSTALGSQYEHDLFVGDINNGRLYRFQLNATRTGFVFQGAGLADLVADTAAELDEVIFGTGFGGITDIKVGPDGLLYVVSFSGSIYVISPGEPTDEIILDNTPAGQSGAGRSFTGTWCLSAAPSPFGADSLYSCGSGPDTYRWTPTIPTSGAYAVSVRWTQHPNRSTAVPITVCHAGGCTTLTFNQQQNGAQWIPHGQYTFTTTGASGYVQVTDQNGQAAADAVRFVPVPAAGEIILDNALAGQSGAGRSFAGTWCLSAAPSPFGADSLYSCGSGPDTYRWTPTIPTSGAYAVSVRWTQHPNRSTAVPITVCHAGGCTTLTFNQQQNGAQWIPHGQYTFTTTGASGYVQVTDQNGQAAADAVRFVPVPAAGEIILDNALAGQSGAGRSFAGTWCLSAAPSPFGADSLYSCGSGPDTYRWTPTIPTSGTYAVSVRWTQHPNRSTAVPITVCHAGGCTTLTFNQQQNGAQWIPHGQYTFTTTGASGYVQVTDQNGQAAADAVRLVPVP